MLIQWGHTYIYSLNLDPVASHDLLWFLVGVDALATTSLGTNRATLGMNTLLHMQPLEQELAIGGAMQSQ